MTVFEAVLSSDPYIKNYKKYEEAVNRYALDQSDSNFNKMMEAQEEMDQRMHGIIMQKLKRFYLN